MPPIRIRTAALVAIPLAAPLWLAACASKGPPTVAEVAEEEAVIIRSTNPHDYRFDMQQDGKKMSADEFDAWMKSRGVRIATGAPASTPAKPAGKAP